MVASHIAPGFPRYALVGTCESLIAMHYWSLSTDESYSPVNAMAVSIAFTICLTCIAIGSEVAYGIFVSLNVSGLVTSYIICIACMSRL